MSPAAELVSLSGAAPRPAADGISVTHVRVFGTRVWMTHRHDAQEWRRRKSHGLGPVLAWDLLDTLMDLPAGMTVPVADLTGPVLGRLSRAAPGIIRVTPRGVTRLVVPAVTPLLAVIMARDWRGGLVAASRFASYCPRMVIIPGLGGADAEALALAGVYGIGVAVGRARAAEVLLEPEPVPDWEPTPAWWHFTETIYGQAAAAERC